MANKVLNLPHNWSPRDYQQPLWKYLADGGKRAVACWHRRSGKDDVMLHHNACASVERKGNYWYMLPEYNQCRKAVWDAINPHTGIKRIDEAFPDLMRSNINNQEMKLTFKNGSTFQLMGSDNYNSLVGSPPVGLTFSEYALSNPTSWGFLRPIMLENGGWSIFNSTPRGNNHFKKILDLATSEDSWFSQVLTAEETGVFTKEQLLGELKELQSEHGNEYGKALWLQEYYCSFEAAMPGSIWGDCMVKMSVEDRIKAVPHTEGYPVHTGWDLGYDDDTVAWFYQVVGNEIRVIDYMADNFKDIPYYAGELAKRAIEGEWEYGTHWLPHDGRPKTLAGGGKSILQQLWDEEHKLRDQVNLGKFDIAPSLGIEDGIQAARATFPYVYMDSVKCHDGVEHLKSYHRKYDNEKKVFSVKAEHDGSSHAADAWRTVSLTWRFSKAEQRVVSFDEVLANGNITAVNFGDLKKAHFSKMRRERAH